MPTFTERSNTAAHWRHRRPNTDFEPHRGLAVRHLVLRPVQPQDERLFGSFLLAQSPGTLRSRFHAAVNPSTRLFCQMSQVDPQRQQALVVCTHVDGHEQVVAEARYSTADDGLSAEFALMVDERWRGRGIGQWTLSALQRMAGSAGLTWLQGDVLHDNHAMLALAQRCGFACLAHPQDSQLVQVQQYLDPKGVCMTNGHTKAPVNRLLDRLRRVFWGPSLAPPH